MVPSDLACIFPPPGHPVLNNVRILGSDAGPVCVNPAVASVLKLAIDLLDTLAGHYHVVKAHLFDEAEAMKMTMFAMNSRYQSMICQGHRQFLFMDMV